MNRTEVIGHLGRDPEMSYTPGGKAVTKFSVAVSRKWGQGSERKEATTWFNVVSWDKLAETCSSYLAKGSKVYLAGRMESRKYTNKDNQEVTVWELTATELEMLDGKPANGGQRGQGSNAGAGDIGPDDIPF